MLNFIGIFRSASLILLLLVTLPALALSTPAGLNIISPYAPVENPVTGNTADTSKPIGMGNVAEGGDTLSLNVQLEPLDTAADLYFAFFFPDIAPSTVYFMNDKGGIEPFTGILPPWKRNVTNTINTAVLPDIPVSLLPAGDYSFFLIQSPAGSNPVDTSYLWSSTLKLKKGVLLDTGNPSSPYIYAHRSRATIQFNANPDTGAMNGATIISPQGQILNMGMDEKTGLPTQMVVEETIYQIENIRLNEGLADLAIINTDGEIEYFFDIDYQTSQKRTSKNVGLVSSGSQYGVQTRTTNFINDSLNSDVFNAFNTSWYVLACSMTKVALIAKLGKLPEKVFDVTTAVAGCSSAMSAMIDELNTDPDSVSTDDALEIAAELSSLGFDIFSAAGSCASAAVSGGLAAPLCLYSLTEVAKFSGSKTVERLLAAHLLARDHMRAKIAQQAEISFKTFCCVGPTRIEVGEEGSWMAMITDGAGIKPYRYVYKWQDGIGDTIDNAGITAFGDHTYKQTGSYTIKVEAFDSSFHFADSNLFKVEVVDKIEPLTVSCCNGDSQVKKNTTHTWQPVINGGVTPYEVSIDWGDKNTNAFLVLDGTGKLTPKHSYAKDGVYQIKTTVTDFMGKTVTSEPFEVIVGTVLDCATYATYPKICGPSELYVQLWLDDVKVLTTYYDGETKTERKSFVQSGSFVGQVKALGPQGKNIFTWNKKDSIGHTLIDLGASQLEITFNETGTAVESLNLSINKALPNDTALEYPKALMITGNNTSSPIPLDTRSLLNGEVQKYLPYQIRDEAVCDFVKTYTYKSVGFTSSEVKDYTCQEGTTGGPRVLTVQFKFPD